MPIDLASFAIASTAPFEEVTSDDLDSIDPNLSIDEFVSPKPTGDQKELTIGSGPLNAQETRLVKIQVLLDREGLSPGVINGKRSDYLERLIEIYLEQTDVDLNSFSLEEIDLLLEKSGGDFLQTYELTQNDVNGPFTTHIPSRIQDQGDLKKLNFGSPREAIAERFHMDELFLARINPNVNFAVAGSKIKVANVGRYLDKWVARIHADQDLRQVTAFDRSGKILAVYPASIGSSQTPSPRGSFKVRNKAGFPAYTLAANNGFEKLDNNQQVVVAPGPNNPVGSAWIGLSKKTYGIHGTPEPSFIGRAESHGCIRLTNWDALELARLVKTGIEVTID